jgi:hypothetical protein
VHGMRRGQSHGAPVAEGVEQRATLLLLSVLQGE